MPRQSQLLKAKTKEKSSKAFKKGERPATYNAPTIESRLTFHQKLCKPEDNGTASLKKKEGLPWLSSGPGSLPGSGTRSPTPQLRFLHVAVKNKDPTRCH